MKKKPIYLVWITRPGVRIGIQPAKANNAKEAKAKVKKRWPKARILDCEKARPDTESYILQSAI